MRGGEKTQSARERVAGGAGRVADSSAACKGAELSAGPGAQVQMSERARPLCPVCGRLTCRRDLVTLAVHGPAPSLQKVQLA